MASGLSLGTDADMHAMIHGGPEFLDRLAKIQEATKQHDHALKQLYTGKNLQADRDEAARVLAATKEKCDKQVAEANKHADDVRERVNSHEASAKAATNDALNAAYRKDAEAEAKLLGAKEALTKAVKTRDEAIENAEKIKNEARIHALNIVQDAKAEAATVRQEANIIFDNAKSTNDRAEELLARLQGKLAAFKNLADD